MSKPLADVGGEKDLCVVRSDTGSYRSSSERRADLALASEEATMREM